MLEYCVFIRVRSAPDDTLRLCIILIDSYLAEHFYDVSHNFHFMRSESHLDVDEIILLLTSIHENIVEGRLDFHGRAVSRCIGSARLVCVFLGIVSRCACRLAEVLGHPKLVVTTLPLAQCQLRATCDIRIVLGKRSSQKRAILIAYAAPLVARPHRKRPPRAMGSQTVLLVTANVLLRAENGTFVSARAQCDSESQENLVTAECQRRVGVRPNSAGRTLSVDIDA